MYKYLKRPLDFLISLIALVILSPIFLIIAVWIKLNSKGPVFFRQKRVGKNKELFEIYKFRSMRTDTPSDMPTHLLNDPDAFITSSGKFLRKTSLDELPQLINIIKGDMAIIGPRPALWNQYDLIDERDKYGANDIRPGLTGWAQINGRDELEIPIKAKLDADYVKNISFLFDLKCFFGTISSVLKSDGVVEGGTGVIEKAKKDVKDNQA
ncbi:sugar transferase [Aerococcus viridans]